MGDPGQLTAYQRCRQALVRSGSDPLLLVWLLAAKDVLRSTSLGRSLVEACSKEGVTTLNAEFLAELREAEQRARKTELKQMDLSLCFYASTKQAALDGLRDLLNGRKLRGPVQPFLIQTATGDGTFSGSLFIACAFAQDAIILLSAMHKTGGLTYKGRWVKVITTFEHQSQVSADPSQTGLTNYIIDWEILLKAYCDKDGANRKTLEEIRAIGLNTPLFVYKRMLGKGVLDENMPVSVSVKEKSRPVLDQQGNVVDSKVSFHFVFDIMGNPQQHHAKTTHCLFSEFTESLDRFKKEKCLPYSLTDDELSSPEWGVDVKACHPKQPFATIGSRKKSSDPYPVNRGRLVFHKGQLVRTYPPPISDDTEIHLRDTLFTIPRHNAANYKASFILECNTKAVKVSENRTPKNCHQTTSQRGARGPPSFDGSQHFPPWFRPHASAKGVFFNNSLPCLEPMEKELQTALQCGSVRVLHTVGIFCPFKLCDANLVIHTHHSNGVLWAVTDSDPSTIYAKCFHCSAPTDRVEGIDPILNTWMPFNEQSLNKLMAMAKSHSQPGTLPMCLYVITLYLKRTRDV